jgi:ankyrin repeat protein
MYLDSFEFTDVHRTVLGLLPIKISDIIDNPILNSQLNTPDAQGRTPIFWAALRGDYQTVEQLLMAKANIDTVNCSLDTPLHAAAKAKNVRTLEILLMAGAKVDARDCFGWTPLHKVCRWQTDVAYGKCLILAGASVNATNRYGSTSLARAARYNRYDLALTLINNNANMNICNKDGNNPIFEAVIRHSNKVLRLLISRGADYTIINNAGWSLLHAVANYGSVATIQILFEFQIRGLDPLLKDKRGKTPQEILHTRVASPLGFVAAFEKLLEHLASVKAEDDAFFASTVKQNTKGAYESDEECFYNAFEWISTVS